MRAWGRKARRTRIDARDFLPRIEKNLPAFCLRFCLPTYLSTCLLDCLPIYVSIYLPVCLSARLPSIRSTAPFTPETSHNDERLSADWLVGWSNSNLSINPVTNLTKASQWSFFNTLFDCDDETIFRLPCFIHHCRDATLKRVGKIKRECAI